VFRVVSILLYAAGCLALLKLGSRVLPFRLALGGALLFAAHPVHVEAVAVAVAQNELLVGLLAAIATVVYLDRRRAGEGQLRLGDWLLLGGLYLMASLAKENGLVLPGLLLAAEVLLVEGREPIGPRARRLLPGYGGLAVVAIVVLLARTAVLAGRLEPGVPADALVGLSTGERLFTALKVIPESVRLLLFPVRLSADYGVQQLTASTSVGLMEALGLLLLGGGGLLAWRFRRKAPVLSFGILWMAIGWLPVSNLLIPTGVLLAERTLFLSSMGLVLALGGGLAAVWPAAPEARPATVRLFWTAVGVLVLAGVIRSGLRQRDWRDESTLAYRTAETAPRSWRAQMAYGNTLMEQAHWDRGVEAYQRSIDLAPRTLAWQSRNKLAEWYFQRGADGPAVDQLRQSLAEVPNNRQTWHFLILGYLSLGEYPVAIRLADSILARGGSPELFVPLRAVADTAMREKWPPGTVRIQTGR
jgi:hypothetical protein